MERPTRLSLSLAVDSLTYSAIGGVVRKEIALMLNIYREIVVDTLSH